MSIKEYPVCITCNSADVGRDAWVSWNIDKQNWEIESIYDSAECNDCEGECNLKWQLLENNDESMAHEIWASAQLLPGEGIEDGVNRIIRILQAQKEQTK